MILNGLLKSFGQCLLGLKIGKNYIQNGLKNMRNTLDIIISKFGLNVSRKSPIEIRNINRTVMAKVLGELKFKVGAEVGVAQGNHAKLLYEENPELKLYCIDVWDRYPGYKEYTNRIER